MKTFDRSDLKVLQYARLKGLEWVKKNHPEKKDVIQYVKLSYPQISIASKTSKE